MCFILFFFSSRRRHTRSLCDWSSDVCSSDLAQLPESQVGAVLSLPEGERLRRLAGVPAILHVKGAPERILASCSHHIVDGERRPLSEYDRSQYQFRNQELATRAFRVIGLAVREFHGELPPLKEDTL